MFSRMREPGRLSVDAVTVSVVPAAAVGVRNFDDETWILRRNCPLRLDWANGKRVSSILTRPSFDVVVVVVVRP